MGTSGSTRGMFSSGVLFSRRACSGTMEQSMWHRILLFGSLRIRMATAWPINATLTK